MLATNFNQVLEALVILSFDIIRPHRDLSEVPPEVVNNTKYWPYFKDAIGALDGTLIDAIVSDTNGVPFRDRHGRKSWNVLACCSFDRIYTFINVGWEGSVHDTTV
uniref:DDE Tnp4 domain-containing protein n=1 Tax=Chenopodium quinoa TaxID=63459 RepID=A0A803N9T8_CHEQI